MVERAKWYVFLLKRGTTSTTTIEGIRLIDKTVMGGGIMPGEWFRDVLDSDFQNLFVEGYRAVQAYTPSADELPILYTLYPAMMPKGLKPVVGGAGSLKNKWYKIAEHSQMVCGVTALCTVPGVCKAGDVARAGDIVPAQWFAGLSIEQLGRMERTGAQSLVWLDAQDSEFRAKSGFKPPIERYAPNPIEILSLYEKFAGANPQAEIASNTEELMEGGK